MHAVPSAGHCTGLGACSKRMHYLYCLIGMRHLAGDTVMFIGRADFQWVSLALSGPDGHSIVLHKVPTVIFSRYPV